MKKHLNQDHYQTMPWKNGGGITTELFRVAGEDGFVFRLSMARVKTDGPFSLFPHTDRTLFLLEGEGIVLTFPDKKVSLDKKLSPIYFPGEEHINARLIDGSILDFNVMIDRRWGKCQTEITNTSQIKAFEDLVFVFDPRSKNLVMMEKGDEFKTDSDERLVIIRVQRN